MRKISHLIQISVAFVPLFVTACNAQTPPPTATNATKPQPAPHTHTETSSGQILYQFDWRWGKAQADADGQGWQVTNNLGYDIHVTRGYVVNASAELVACPHSHASGPAPTLGAALADVVNSAFGPQVAMAGHGGESDASRMKIPQVQSLTAPTAITVPAAWGSEPSYCEVHYLLAYGVAAAQNLPTDVNMIGNSILIEGEFRAAGADVATPFKLASPLAWGTSKTLLPTADNKASSANTGVQAGTFLRLVITRDLGALFDGVDFRQMSAQAQSTQLLRAITEHTSVEAHYK